MKGIVEIQKIFFWFHEDSAHLCFSASLSHRKVKRNPKMNLGGAALNKLKQFCCKFSQYWVSNFKPLKEFAGIKKNQRHACNMDAFVFVLPCKACLLPFTEQRALSWIWSPHSPQTDHLISFYNTKDAFFCWGNICCKIYKTKADRETDHFTSFLPGKRYPFCYKARADMICQRIFV